MGLSERVAAAVEPAVNMIQKLIGDLSQTDRCWAGAKKSKTRSKYQIVTK